MITIWDGHMQTHGHQWPIAALALWQTSSVPRSWTSENPDRGAQGLYDFDVTGVCLFYLCGSTSSSCLAFFKHPQTSFGALYL